MVSRFRLPGSIAAALNQNAVAAATATDIPSSVSHATSEKAINEKGVATNYATVSDSESDLGHKIDPDAQHGTQQTQAMNQVWSKRSLVFAFASIWCIEFILAFGNGVVGTLTPYVTSLYEAHSLTALTSVIAFLIAGLFKLPYAKIMDIWGRPQALALAVFLLTLGCILMATVNSVEQYCAAQVFYWTGYLAIDFSITIFIADYTQLKNRGLLIGLTSSPFLITTWVYGFAANDIVYGSTGIKLGFGIFAICYPVVCAPWLIMLIWHQRKATKLGLIPARPSRGNFLQSFVYYCKEFDVIGLLILATGFSLFLLAFNLYSLQPDTWKSPMIICFIIFGFLLIVGFGVWERFFAPVTFIPWHLITNRTVIFTYVMAGSLYVGWYIWDGYFYSVLIVLFDQPVLYATYITQTYTMGSCFICILFGVALRYYGKLKIWALFWGAPLTMLGVGLMIAFRQPNVNIGLIVMCQVFIAFGGGVLVICEQTTLMCVSKQRDYPALLAVESTIISIGSAIGQTIAGAMWTGIFPVKLAENLPAEAQDPVTFASIYGSLFTQTSYDVGTPTRDAINLSYGETQRLMLIAATCIYAITLLSVALWENVDVRKDKENRRQIEEAVVV
ncbi:hypothetical protein AMS68_002092 [Peltaster fructicola]|uniref:Major facilitator superfamily (MFS) profile domain-containing protein n=1 Tax=Peltaster fructicola TaxID=286661 RepID=A0A6H0XPL5_9PEZI|nr:hypothetical protein AMS68_002092 [Peltaster fructicola]